MLRNLYAQLYYQRALKFYSQTSNSTKFYSLQKIKRSDFKKNAYYIFTHADFAEKRILREVFRPKK